MRRLYRCAQPTPAPAAPPSAPAGKPEHEASDYNSHRLECPLRPNFASRKILTLVATAAIAAVGACAPKATPPPVDDMATAVAQLAIDMLSQTAAAASPTPTATLTPSPTETPPAATATSEDAGRMPMTLTYAACWFGPGPSWALESNISKGKGVELLGIGNVPGWYIIRNPYFHQPCWIQAADLKIFEGTDLTQYPVMTPGGP